MLLLVLLAIPVVYTGLRWFHTMSRVRAWTAVIARSILIALIAGILAGAAAVQRTDRLAVIAVVDVSDSMRTFASEFGEMGPGPAGTTRQWPVAIREWLERASAKRGPDDLLGVVAFDGAAIAVATPTVAPLTGVSVDYQIAQGTDIAGALRFAEALFPPDASRRLILASDGDETTGDALRAAEQLGGGVAIDVLPVSYRVEHEVMVERVDVPPQASQGATVTVRVVLNATNATSGRLDLLYEGEPIDINGTQRGKGRDVRLHAGRNVIPIDVELSDAVVHRFEPVFTPDDPADDRIASNNRAETFTVTPGDGSVLIVDGTHTGARSALYRTLRDNGIRVEITEPLALPNNLLALQAYDLIILDDVPAEDIERPTQGLLADYVQKLGGGLVMAGGPDSFGAGGWNGTPIEPILPVKLDLPEEIITPSAAIVFVLDSSGSMAQKVLGGSKSQQQIANESAALAIATLDKTDLISVIAFESNYQIVVPLSRNTDPERAAARVRSISPGGGTNLYPALAAAGQMLRTTDATVKHVIVLSDGQSQGEPVEGVQIAQQMRDDGITISAIAVGDGADFDTLGRLAQAGGGAFYPVYDPNTLPRVFVKEIRVVRRPLIRESPFTPVDLGSGSPLIAGMPGDYPPLRGIVLTQRRDDPKITYALATPKGEPLLAHWFVGRGQVAAFTSGAHYWARDWISERWPGYAKMWTQIARGVARPSSGRNYELTTEIDADEMVIRLDAFDESGKPRDMLSIDGTVYLPDGGETDVRLAQVGPGTYEARVPATLRGNYVVALLPRQGEQLLAPVVGGTSRAVGPEFRRLQSNVGLLRDIASATGGRVLSLDTPETSELFDRSDTTPARAAAPLWPKLLAMCFFVFLLDVATRRVAWDRLVTRELRQEIASKAAHVAKARSERAAQTVAGLKGAEVRKAAPRREGPPPPPPPLRRFTRTTPAAPPAMPGASAESEAARSEEFERRRAALRKQALSEIAGTGNKGAAPGGPGKSADRPAEKEDDSETTAGLLAAKRRLRAKFEEEAEEGDDEARDRS